MTLFLVELDGELLGHIARGIELRRAELRSMGVRHPALADAEAAFKGQHGSGQDQERPCWTPAPFLSHVRPVRMTLTIDEAADELRVSASTVKRLVQSGALPTIKIERSTRIRRQDLEEYVAGLGPASFRDAVHTKGR